MPYPNYHAARVKSPGSFVSIKVLQTTPNGVMIYGGKLKTNRGGKATAQSYRFPKAEFTATQAKKWLKDQKIESIAFEPATGTKKSVGEWLMEKVLQQTKE